MTASSIKRSRLDIGGLDCADCARTLERRLGETPGVSSCAVRFETGTADVAFDPGVVSDGVLRSRIRELGYSVGRPTDRRSEREFMVSGMDCADCARTLQASIAALPGVSSAEVVFGAGTLRLEADPSLVPDAQIRATAQRLGYRAEPAESRSSDETKTLSIPRRTWEIAVAAALVLVALGLSAFTDLVVLPASLHVIAAVVAGYPVARAALISIKVRRADMNLLMTIAAVGAMALQDWAEASTLMVLFAIGLALQSATIDRTRGAIRELMSIAPQTARIVRKGRIETVPVEDVATDDIVDIMAGERVPIDGVVLSGTSALDQSAITGESLPRPVEVGSEVISGSVNGDGHLTVRATAPGTDTTVSRIIHLVETAHQSKAPVQALVDRFAAIYTPSVVIGAIALAVGGLLFSSGDTDWIYRALILLVVACPCALVISTPVAIVSALGRASRMGVLFKGGSALEALAGVKQIAFDKTGTLTHGRPEVVAVSSVNGLDRDEVLALAAALEHGTTHPIGRGIVRAADGLPRPAVANLQVRAGRGIVGQVGADTVEVGSTALFEDIPAELGRRIDDGRALGQSVVLVGRNGVAEAAITVADSIRPISPAVISLIESLGLHPMLLSGDVAAVANRIGAETGISDVRADLLPADKASFIAEANRTTPTAMVGDGINDAPALAAARVGIAMGAGGSAAAIEAADVALMGDDLTALPRSITLARSTRSIILQNIAFALAMKLGFLVLTVSGFTSLWLAVVADVGASLLVTLNALRLMRGQDKTHSI
jgi:Cd2+/Zn2+-exporting ATPase